MTDSLDMDIGYARNRWGIRNEGDMKPMTRDLTDHVREKDEAEGPHHKLVTNAEAEKIAGLDRIRLEMVNDPKHKWMSDSERLSTKASVGVTLRLLADREAMLEIIEALKAPSLMDPGGKCLYCTSTREDTGFWRHLESCPTIKARRIIEAVEK